MIASVSGWLTSLLNVTGVTSRPAGFWLPRQGSDVAAGVDWNFAFVYWISMFFFCLVTFIMVFFILRYRARPGHQEQKSASHNTTLEVLWSVIPTLIVMVMFWFGYQSYLDMITPPQNAYAVNVLAQKWSWQFEYPNGHVDSELHVPVDTPIELVMTSQDVIHSFFVPDFRVKRDVMPGRYDKVWFTPLDVGVFDIFCAEYCGTSHSDMLAKLFVHSRGDFEAWLEDAANLLGKYPPEEAGAILYDKRGCKQCHTVDGSASTGPSFKGSFGASHALTDGSTIVVDENYIRESILLPQAKVAAGFEPVMPTYQGRLKDEEIGAIIAYLKTLAADGGS